MTPDPVELLAPDALAALVDAKLRRLGRAAQASPFQRARVPADLTRATLAAVPVLAKDAWVAASPPRSNDALTGPLTAAYVFRSGGSTGEPKFSVFAADEYAATMPVFRRSYGAAGLAPGDRVANLFAAGGLYASFVFVNRMVEEMGCLNFPYATAGAPEVVADGAARFGFDALLGFPSWLLQVAPAIAARGATVPKVFYAGEHLHQDDRERLAELLGATTIASAGYAAVDTGLIGYQCGAMTGGEHHVLADHAVVEILDPETLAPVPDGEPGLLVVTNLERLLHPVIRYVVGDVARMVPGPCPCGRTAPRFVLLGRGDDALRLAYATLTRAEILGAIDDLVPAGTVQLVKRRVDGLEGLLIRHEGTAPDEALVARVLALKPDLAKLVASGTLAPVGVEALPPGGIPRVALTGKFRGVVDEAT